MVTQQRPKIPELSHVAEILAATAQTVRVKLICRHAE